MEIQFAGAAVLTSGYERSQTFAGEPMSHVRLWVVCPSYHDIPSFLILRTRVLEILDATEPFDGRSVCFVVVDDTAGYDDDTDELASLEDVSIVTPPFNLGHQRALVYGLRTLLPQVKDTDVIVTMDADGEDRPEDLPRLLEPLVVDTMDRRGLTIARRTKRSETLRFRLLYTGFRAMFRLLTGTAVRSGNFAAYRGWLARRILVHPYFDLCYSSTLISLNLLPTMVPCARGRRYEGRSRMNVLRLFMHGIRMLMPFTDRVAVRALVGFCSVFAIGIALSSVVVGIRLFTNYAIPGWTTITLLSMLLVSLVSLGNFVVLFAVFSHSRGISLANLEEWDGRRSRIASSASD